MIGKRINKIVDECLEIDIGGVKANCLRQISLRKREKIEPKF